MQLCRATGTERYVDKAHLLMYVVTTSYHVEYCQRGARRTESCSSRQLQSSEDDRRVENEERFIEGTPASHQELCETRASGDRLGAASAQRGLQAAVRRVASRRPSGRQIKRESQLLYRAHRMVPQQQCNGRYMCGFCLFGI